MDASIVEKRKEVESFFVFLKTNNSLELYVSNIKKHKRNNWHTFFYRHNMVFFVVSAFFWSRTPEGCLFWSRINQKWKYLCRNNTL